MESGLAGWAPASKLCGHRQQEVLLARKGGWSGEGRREGAGGRSAWEGLEGWEPQQAGKGRGKSDSSCTERSFWIKGTRRQVRKTVKEKEPSHLASGSTSQPADPQESQRGLGGGEWGGWLGSLPQWWGTLAAKE